MKVRIAIIGAGISGLTLAQNLKDLAEVTVFEKARGIGGRMSTRSKDQFSFDHGAHTFTARGKLFKEFLAPYIKDGTVAEWKGKVVNLEAGKKTTKRLWFEPHLVSSPTMNSLCKKMASDTKVVLSTEIAPLHEKKNDGWHLFDTANNLLGIFDWVISTAPPAQTIALFNKHLKETSLHNSEMQGCYSLMIGFNKPWDKQWIAAKVRNNPIKWISVNSTKPGRNNEVTCFVAHSRNSWADEHIGDDIKDVETSLIKQFEEVTGISCKDADYISTHRWKYALVRKTEKSGVYIDAKTGLAATSDWCSTSRAEDAWLNAFKLAEDLKGSLL